jgi:tetratricopeptide (TPR) repeat protein
MNIPAIFLAVAALLYSVAGPAVAQETPPSVAPGEPPAAVPEKELTKTERIDELLATLKTAKDERAAREAEAAVIRLWLESGSDTVDLLMSWSMKAIEAKNFPQALDFLDRVVLMKPDYVEGWNKRATVHFALDNFSQSLSDISRVLEIEPRHFGALSGLGMILREVGEEQKALAAYRQALEIDPYLPTVREALDDLENETGGDDL